MAFRSMSTSNSDSNEFTASECSDSEDLYSNKSTESSESNQSSSDEENEQNEVYPPEEEFAFWSRVEGN